MSSYYNKKGILTTNLTDETIVYEHNNTMSIVDGDNTADIEIKLISLGQKVVDQMFGSVQNFNNILPYYSTTFQYGGISAELMISKNDFDKLINSIKSPDTYKLLYYFGFQNIVDSLINLVLESKLLFCNFYKTLNNNSFMLSEEPVEQTTVIFAAGEHVTILFSIVNHLFINLASQLDLITKIAFELENMPSDFSFYPKLKSGTVLYGDSKKIKSIPFDNTVFEQTDDLKLILSLRNEIIHNASFEGVQKIYLLFMNGKMEEKFILIPDNTNGILDSFRNRRRFFSTETKLNENLPRLATDFWLKIEATIDKISRFPPFSTRNKGVLIYVYGVQVDS